jgi:hypothetical protein
MAVLTRKVIAAPPCACAQGWTCADHDGQPFAHDGCAGAGVRCHSALCPYWQPVVGTRQRLALDPSIQFDHGVGWREGSTRH